MKKESKKWVLIVIYGLCCLSSCVIKKDSPAPGCIEYVGIPSAGGCFGKTVILDIQVEPVMDCLAVEANNCNGGVLEIKNSCEEIVVVEGFEIPASGRATFDVVAMEDGQLSLQEIYSNFSEFVPEKDTLVMLNGLVNSQEIEITFTKTRALCE
jgi:hypothetical protein